MLYKWNFITGTDVCTYIGTHTCTDWWLYKMLYMYKILYNVSTRGLYHWYIPLVFIVLVYPLYIRCISYVYPLYILGWKIGEYIQSLDMLFPIYLPPIYLLYIYLSTSYLSTYLSISTKILYLYVYQLCTCTCINICTSMRNY